MSRVVWKRVGEVVLDVLVVAVVIVATALVEKLARAVGDFGSGGEIDEGERP